jgi:hypothetical protein
MGSMNWRPMYVGSDEWVAVHVGSMNGWRCMWARRLGAVYACGLDESVLYMHAGARGIGGVWMWASMNESAVYMHVGMMNKSAVYLHVAGSMNASPVLYMHVGLMNASAEYMHEGSTNVGSMNASSAPYMHVGLMNASAEYMHEGSMNESPAVYA